MNPWYVPSLYPILILSASLGALILWRDRRHWPIAAYCGSLTAWSAAILLAAGDSTRAWGDRTMMVGFFVPATFLHVAARDLGWQGWGRRVVGIVYALGTAVTLGGLAVPGLFVGGGGTEPGPAFAPMFAATIAVGAVPLWLLWRSPDDPGSHERRRYLLLAGVAMAVGGGLNVVLMLDGTSYPLGLYLLCCSVGLMTYVAQAERLPTFSRFVERSQRYALLAAVLSTVWMLMLLGVVAGISGEGSAPPERVRGWTWEAALLLFVLTLTAQPLLTEARIRLTDTVFPGQGDADGLTRALADSEARAEHAGRLAHIGTMASAVAHEVRNPLGVIAACAAVLERQGASAEVLAEIRDQVDRAARFADELLAYGRPAPPSLREVSLADTVRIAASEVARALGTGSSAVSVEGDRTVRADPAQLVRLWSALVENALLAGATRVQVEIDGASPRVRAAIDDDGPGVPEVLAARLFEPFVSGRGRSGPRPGTGLGLAIAAGIAERHHGTLSYAGRSPLGGARFVAVLPEDGGGP